MKVKKNFENFKKFLKKTCKTFIFLLLFVSKRRE